VGKNARWGAGGGRGRRPGQLEGRKKTPPNPPPYHLPVKGHLVTWSTKPAPPRPARREGRNSARTGSWRGALAGILDRGGSTEHSGTGSSKSYKRSKQTKLGWGPDPGPLRHRHPPDTEDLVNMRGSSILPVAAWSRDSRRTETAGRPPQTVRWSRDQDEWMKRGATAGRHPPPTATTWRGLRRIPPGSTPPRSHAAALGWQGSSFLVPKRHPPPPCKPSLTVAAGQQGLPTL